MAELMDKQGILDELNRRNGAQQPQTPLMNKDQILLSLQKRASGQSAKPEVSPYTNPDSSLLANRGKFDAPLTGTQQPQQENPKWFQSGAFADGYQFGDLSKTWFGTQKDVRENLYSGVVGAGEKALDFLMSIAPYLSGASPWSETAVSAPMVHQQAQRQQLESAKDLVSGVVEKDLIDEQKVAQTMDKITGGIGNIALIGEKADDVSVLGEKTDSIVQSLGQMALTKAMGGMVPWWVVTGATSLGGEAENAVRQGASLDQAVASGLVSAGAEVLSEKLFGGSGLGEKGFLNLDALTSGIANKLWKTLADYGVDMASEGLEEVFSSVVSNLGSALYREEKLVDILASEEALQEYLDSFVSGAVVSGMMNVGKVGSSIANKTDYRNGLTAQQQKVFDQQYNAEIKAAEKSGKLTREQRAAIYDATLESVRAQQPQSATQSEETAKAEKVPTQAESAVGGQQTAQTVQQTAIGNQQTMTPQQAMQETIAEIIGVPSVSQAVESYRESGTVTNKQAEAIASNANAVQELLEMAGIAKPSTKSQTRAAVKQAIAKLAQETVSDNAKIASESTGADATIAETVVPTDSTTTARPEIRNDEAWEDYQRRLAEWEARQNQTSGFSSVGAANDGFSKPSPVDPLIEQYGSLPSGENPVRSDELPKSVTGQDRVSQTAVTVKGAQATPDDFVDMLDEDVAKGGMSYIPIKNSDTTQEAVDYINREGWTQALANWTAAVNSGKSGADLVAQGALLLNNAATAGSKKQWLDILHTYQKLGTNTAQGLQAMRILKTLQPSDKLYMIRRSVEQMVDDLKLKTEIVLDEDLMESYRNAETDAERDEILSQIQQSVAEQIPSTFMDKVNALRYLNMLGNLKTQVRNFAGNATMAAVSTIKNEVGAGIELIANKVSGGKVKRTKSFGVSKEQLAAAKNDFDSAKEIVTGERRYDDRNNESDAFRRGVLQNKRVFKNKALEGYRKLTSEVMEKGDLLFSKPAYARALAGYLKANGITETDYSKIDQEFLDEARLYAINEAQEQTFRDTNMLAEAVSKRYRGNNKVLKAGDALLNAIIPFRKTPANVLLRAEEYSPLGIANALWNTVQAGRDGSGVTANDAINSWAKTLTGSGLFALGMLLSNLGLLSAGADEDKDKEAFESLSGYQNYAFVARDGTNVTIDFLSPAAIPLLMGADLMEAIHENGFTLEAFWDTAMSMTEPMIQMSMLQSLNDTIEDVRYSDDPSGQIVVNAALNYLMQATTNTLFGQLERGTEDVRMTTYVDKNSPVPDWLQKFLGKASAKTPIWEYNQIPYINAWGEEEENLPTGLNLVYNLLSPGYVESGRKDALTEELNRLGTSTGESVYPDRAPTYVTVDGERVHFSAEEYVSFAKDMGQTQKKLLEQVLAVPGYKDLPDMQKAKVVQAVYEYARATAAERAVPKYDASVAKWMKTAEIRGNLPEAIVRSIRENAEKAEKDAQKEAAREAYWAAKNGQ